MAEENDLDVDLITHRATISTSNSPVVEADKNLGKITDAEQNSERSKGRKDSTNTVPYFKLFSFADSRDIALMVIGTIAAVSNGANLPLMTVLFGELIDSANTKDMVHEVSKVYICHIIRLIVPLTRLPIGMVLFNMNEGLI